MKNPLTSILVLLALGVAACGTEPALNTTTSPVVEKPKFTIGVLVSPDDATVSKYLVTKNQDTITAYVALKDTSIDVVSMTNSFGTSICAISGIGHPTGPCFGAPTDPSWAFFIRNSDGGWTYPTYPTYPTPAADQFLLQDGDVVAFMYTNYHDDGTGNFVTDRTPPMVQLSDFTPRS